MLQQPEYDVLISLLEGGVLRRPQVIRRPLSHVSQGSLTCHLIAMQAGIETGEPPVLGVHFLNLYGKLYPWAHVVNYSHQELVDYSQDPIVLPDFGFATIPWGQFEAWRNIMVAYRHLEAMGLLPKWGDRLADDLTEQFLPMLQQTAQAHSKGATCC